MYKYVCVIKQGAMQLHEIRHMPKHYKAPPYNVHMTAYVITEQNTHTEDMTHTHILYMTSIAYVYVRALECILCLS